MTHNNSRGSICWHMVSYKFSCSFLFLEKVWVFPLALALFSLLVTFSVFRLSLSWSWILAGFVAFDLIVIWLIEKEWWAVLKLKAPHALADVE